MKGKIILLVEDNPDDELLTIQALKANNIKNEVVVARDGVEALDYFSSNRPLPQVVLLDLKLPKVDGLEVLRQIKNDPTLRLTPVVMLTSSREEVDLLRSYQLGVNAYVVKPVAFGEFMEAVKQLGAFWAVLNERPQIPAGGTSA